MRDPKSYITLSDDPVSRANAFLAEVSATHYQEWMHEDLKALMQAYQDFCHTPDAERVAVLAKSFQAMQDLGGTFNYPLISEIGLRASRFLEAVLPKEPKEMELLHVFVESMQVVIENKMSGDGGAAGKGLMNGIVAAYSKVR